MSRSRSSRPRSPEPVIPTWTGPDFTASTNSIDLDLSANSLEFEENAPRTDVTAGADADAYFAFGNNVPVYDFTPIAFTGSAFSDRMIGNDSHNTLKGGAGNDFIYGGAGDDKLYGDDGDDTSTAAQVTTTSTAATAGTPSPVVTVTT